MNTNLIVLSLIFGLLISYGFGMNRKIDKIQETLEKIAILQQTNIEKQEK